MTGRLTGRLIGLLLLLLLTSGAKCAYVPSALPPLEEETTTIATAVNSRGFIAGYNITSSGFQAVVWDGEGNPTALPPLPGDNTTTAQDINGSGQVVGRSGFVPMHPPIPNDLLRFPNDLLGIPALDLDGSEQVVASGGGPGTTAVLWRRDGHPTALPPLEGDVNSEAEAVNAWGEVAGSSLSDIWSGSMRTAVRWDRDGHPTALLPLPGDRDSEATDINWRGEVAGNSGQLFGFATTPTAVVWDREGNTTVLPPLPGDSLSFAAAINASGKVAGWSGVPGNRGPQGLTAVVWDRDGNPTALPPLPGGVGGKASGIDALGRVAGSSSDSAVIWDVDGNPSELPPLPGDWLDWKARAYDLNLRGEVVGYGIGTTRGATGSTMKFMAVVWRAAGNSEPGD